ncbi:hypothetical protein [Ralstonia sp. 24A2]|uniref:hypothetical protein n=1 Tax=Ralstonia sp. 24A2 TaxID=3447364 RepID=UPI003F6A036C
MHAPNRRDEQDTVASGALSPACLIRFVRTQGLRLLAGALVGAAISYGITMTLPKQWQAAATLQLGQVYDGRTTVQLEPPIRAIERLRLRSLQEQAFHRLGLEPRSDAGKLFFSTANAKLVRSSDLIEISANGYSPEQAQQFSEALQNEFISQHLRMFEPASKRLTDNLAETDRLIAQSEARRSRLLEVGEAKVAKSRNGETSPDNLLIAELLNSSAEEISRARRDRNDLLEQLNPLRTFNTKPLGAVMVSESPVFPKTGIAVFAGILLGVAAALFSALWTLARVRPPVDQAT